MFTIICTLIAFVVDALLIANTGNQRRIILAQLADGLTSASVGVLLGLHQTATTYAKSLEGNVRQTQRLAALKLVIAVITDAGRQARKAA